MRLKVARPPHQAAQLGGAQRERSLVAAPAGALWQRDEELDALGGRGERGDDVGAVLAERAVDLEEQVVERRRHLLQAAAKEHVSRSHHSVHTTAPSAPSPGRCNRTGAAFTSQCSHHSAIGTFSRLLQQDRHTTTAFTPRRSHHGIHIAAPSEPSPGRCNRTDAACTPRRSHRRVHTAAFTLQLSHHSFHTTTFIPQRSHPSVHITALPPQRSHRRASHRRASHRRASHRRASHLLVW